MLRQQLGHHPKKEKRGEKQKKEQAEILSAEPENGWFQMEIIENEGKHWRRNTGRKEKSHYEREVN